MISQYGARVNQTFDLADNPIYGDAFKKNSNKEKSKTEKVDTFVEQVESDSPYTTLSEVSDVYGGVEKSSRKFKTKYSNKSETYYW